MRQVAALRGVRQARGGVRRARARPLFAPPSTQPGADRDGLALAPGDPSCPAAAFAEAPTGQCLRGQSAGADLWTVCSSPVEDRCCRPTAYVLNHAIQRNLWTGLQDEVGAVLFRPSFSSP